MVAHAESPANKALEINGVFKSSKGFPIGWQHNKWKSPHGVVELIEQKGGNILKILAPESKTAQVFFKKMFSVRAGDRIVISLKLKGEGKGGAGIYLFDANKKWLTRINKLSELSGDFHEFKIPLSIVKRKGESVFFIRIFLIAEKNATVSFKNVKVKISTPIED
jgi:hypothetical protein